MGTLQRIKEYIDFKGITNQKFEIEIGFSNGAFGTQLKKNKTIGVDKLENILIKYPDINVEWLLTGKGEMIKKENGSIVIVDDPHPLRDELLVTKQDLIDSLKEQIRFLKQEISELKKAQENPSSYGMVAESESKLKKK